MKTRTSTNHEYKKGVEDCIKNLESLIHEKGPSPGIILSISALKDMLNKPLPPSLRSMQCPVVKTHKEHVMNKPSAPKKLKLSELKAGEVYECSLYSEKEAKTHINKCLYTISKGRLMIHRAANWEEFDSEDLSLNAFMDDENFRWPNEACFTPTGQKVTS